MILGSWKISLKSPKIELEVLFEKEKKKLWIFNDFTQNAWHGGKKLYDTRHSLTSGCESNKSRSLSIKSFFFRRQ